MIAMMRRVAAGLADLVLPDVCAGCRNRPSRGGGLCTSCAQRLLDLVSLPSCPRCGGTIGPNLPIYEDGCSQCPNPLPRFDRVLRLGPYAGSIRSAVRALKFGAQDQPAGQMADMLAERIATEGDPDTLDVVVPVPMHWTRRVLRGVDHAHVLADRIAGPLGLPVHPSLVRVRRTPQQTRLSRSARLANIRGAFRASAPSRLEGMRVLLIDDVTTTGATAGEAARVLKAAGALRVTLGVLAKAEPPTAYAEAWQST